MSRRGVVIALAVGWLGAVLVIDLATGPDLRLGGLYVIAALIACAALPASGTAVFALAAVALAVASGWWNDSASASSIVVRLIDVGIVGAAAVMIAAVRVRREAQLQRVSALAAVAQRAILPVLPARVGWVSVTARYEASGEDMLVGGDLYDCHSGAGLTRFVIGDVRGKGINAVEQAARVIRAFRQAAASAPALPQVAEQMSRYLSGFFEGDDEAFVTALLVEVRHANRMSVVACGHPPPLLVTPAGRVEAVVAPAGLPLGWGATYAAVDVPWRRGDRLLLMTDGLVEARNSSGEFLPLPDVAAALADGTVDSALDDLLTTVRRHVPRGLLADDLAVVLLENAGNDAGPTLGMGTPALIDLTQPSAPAPRHPPGVSAPR
jgi:serine phosphatase RsbU (regulator of sigma subunit)